MTDTRELAPSVFTSALVEGLETGDADPDQDGRVALDELYDYVYDKVRTLTPNQTPGKWTFGVQGELVIARRSRPVTTPVPLPPELQEAIDSPLAPVRAAVVQELARVLHGIHAGRALVANGHSRSLGTLTRSSGGRRFAWSRVRSLLVSLWSGAGSNRRPSAFQAGTWRPAGRRYVAERLHQTCNCSTT